MCRADEKQTEYKPLRMRRKLATTLAWVLSRGIEMAKTENRKPIGLCLPSIVACLWGLFYYEEIRGAANFCVLLAALGFVAAAALCCYVAWCGHVCGAR